MIELRAEIVERVAAVMRAAKRQGLNLDSEVEKAFPGIPEAIRTEALIEANADGEDDWLIVTASRLGIPLDNQASTPVKGRDIPF